MINIKKFNSLQRLCRITAYDLFFRFIGNLNSIMKKELILDPEVTINEFNYSECLWLKFAQRELISNNSKWVFVFLDHQPSALIFGPRPSNPRPSAAKILQEQIHE